MAQARDLEAEFKASIRGQSRAAKAAGQRYFQVMLAVNHPYQVWSDKIAVDFKRMKDHGDQGAVLTDVEEEGWKLIDTSATYVQMGGITKGKLLVGEATTTSGAVFGVYLFKATEDVARVDRLWERYGSRATG